eukprot:Mycagemm_TRINITY_DN8760_c0_g1::TRINITY_DN8760_c0_g1_i1::g.2868::m.2868 type:complete len:140 gc:universal TRINITY_DN8760_c0_g1_i1:697-278(-)
MTDDVIVQLSAMVTSSMITEFVILTLRPITHRSPTIDTLSAEPSPIFDRPMTQLALICAPAATSAFSFTKLLPSLVGGSNGRNGVAPDATRRLSSAYAARVLTRMHSLSASSRWTRHRAASRRSSRAPDELILYASCKP